MKCCDLHSGMLREPVVFQRATQTSDGAGGYTDVWAAISGSPTRAAVKALSGFERFNNSRIEASSKWRITIRYFSGLLESDRVEIRGRSHNIKFINNIELKDRWLIIDLDGGTAT